MGLASDRLRSGVEILRLTFLGLKLKDVAAPGAMAAVGFDCAAMLWAVTAIVIHSHVVAMVVVLLQVQDMTFFGVPPVASDVWPTNDPTCQGPRKDDAR